MGDDNVPGPLSESNTLLRLISRSSSPQPAAKLATKLGLSMPRLLKQLHRHLRSGEVVSLRSGSRVVYALHPNGQPSGDQTTETTAPTKRAENRFEPAGLDNTRKRLF